MKKYTKNELVPDIIIDFDECEKHSEIYSVIEKATEQTLIYVNNTLIIDSLQINFICNSPNFNNALFYYDNYHCNKPMD